MSELAFLIRTYDIPALTRFILSSANWNSLAILSTTMKSISIPAEHSSKGFSLMMSILAFPHFFHARTLNEGEIPNFDRYTMTVLMPKICLNSSAILLRSFSDIPFTSDNLSGSCSIISSVSSPKWSTMRLTLLDQRL